MSREIWWWGSSKISKTHRLPCSPNPSTRTACSFSLKFCAEFHKTLPYKMMSAFFINFSSSLFLKEQVWSKITHFYEKYIKINFFKTNEAYQNADTLLFLLLFTTGQPDKKILKKYYLWMQVLKKGEKHWVLGIPHRIIYLILKGNFH